MPQLGGTRDSAPWLTVHPCSGSLVELQAVPCDWVGSLAGFLARGRQQAVFSY